MPEEAARKASEMLDAAGEGAKNAGEAISGHAASLKEELEARAGRGGKEFGFTSGKAPQGRPTGLCFVSSPKRIGSPKN